MMRSKLNIDTDFLVKESRQINFVLGGAMIGVFFIIMFSAEMEWYTYVFAAGVFLIPGVIAIARGGKNSIVIRINRRGIYHAEVLITEWQFFYDAKVTEESKLASIKDNFILKLRHYAADRKTIQTRDIPLTNKQDRAEEEIIEAIRFYYSASK
jgi:hypothetical protein